MRLYSTPGSCALSVHIALEWIATPYQLELMARGANRLPAYLAINPNGKVPAIQLENGDVLTQAAAILSWLVDRFPSAGIGPARDQTLERFRLEEMLSYLTSEVHAAYVPFFAPDRFVADPGLFSSVREKALEQVAGHFALLSQQLESRAHLLGDERSVADAYLYVMLRWAEILPDGLKPFPALAGFRAKMEQDPAVVAALSAQGLPQLDE